jgi:TolB-like protein/Tfp pilus assembly protein PilF
MVSSDHRKRRHILCEGRACRLAAWLVVLALLLAVVLLYQDRFGISSGSLSDPQGSARLSYPAQIYYGPANSIAVLPFEYELPEVGAAPDLFLSTGMAESLIEQLVLVTDLQVTSATSSLFFKEREVERQIVAERLRVSHLLEGSIGQMGGGMRITARLFDVKTNQELWSETINAARGELPAVPEGIAAAVTIAMDRQPRREVSGQSLDSEAWWLILEGRQLLRLRGLKNLQRAEAAFRRALEIDSGAATAWQGLAGVYLDPLWPGTDVSPGYEQAREAALKALNLNPGLAAAHVVLSRIRRTIDWDWQGAREAAQEALKWRPGNADVLSNASTIDFIFSDFESAIKYLEQAISRDPLVLQYLLRLGLLYEFSGDYEQALIAYRRLLGLNSGYPAVHAFRARVKLAQENPESALREADQEVHPFWQRYARILALTALERFDERDPLMAQMLLEDTDDAAVQIAEIHAFAGDIDTAFEWLEYALEQRDGGISEIAGNFFFLPLETDERWGDLMLRAGLQ